MASFFQQKQGAAMGSPVSPIVANLYIEHFERRALETACNPPSLWYRYVDDTFTRLGDLDVDEFSQHLNSIDPHIKFTSEQEQDRRLPFLDTCIHINDDGSTKVTVYRKPTHTDQYLNLKSNHHLEHKRSVVRTLFHRALSIVTETQDKQKEIEHVKRALKTNEYPEWMFRIPRKKDKIKDTDKSKKIKINVGIPYVSGTSRVLQRAFKSHGINMNHRPFNSMRQTHVQDGTKS
ncbi:uncharacterized protein [Ptychodera flava]|uniref:uncharacterized protein n=1 Tax=Ptychodera flava TaxID=63121 RepID=UPI00396A1C5D